MSDDDNGFYLAIDTKSGELVTRENRPVYATRDQWEDIPGLWTALIPTAVNGLPFGALPLMDHGVPDVVGKLFSTLNMVSALVEMVATRVEILDRVIAAKSGE